jgi:hypothetical protein
MLITYWGSDASTSLDTLNQREGVCKDFAHLELFFAERLTSLHAIYLLMPQILIHLIFMLV